MVNHRPSATQRKENTKNRLRTKLAIRQGDKKICVCGIMKNESKNINRLFDSLLSLPPDSISICDSGSSDNTPDLIKEWGRKHNIPTAIHYVPFKNFGYNRTMSIKKAKEAFPEADYFLLTDGDFVWETHVGGKFDKSLLIDEMYLIEQYNKVLRYWNIRMLSAKVDWTCYGVTHEYFAQSKTQTTFNGYARTGKIRTLVIDDREDGGAKADKFERDERLLKEGLADPDTPDDLKTRYKFYLAQTMKDMGQGTSNPKCFLESIDWYNKRIADGGWGEEVYQARYRNGNNFEMLAWGLKRVTELQSQEKKEDKDEEYLQKWNPDKKPNSELLPLIKHYFTEAAKYYFDAYTYRKIRAESLYNLTRMYRMLGLNEIAYKYAVMGQKITYPQEETLFVEPACYDYLFDYEISIVAFYLKEHKEKGREAVSRLRQRTDLPDYINKQVEENSRHYL